MLHWLSSDVVYMAEEIGKLYSNTKFLEILPADLSSPSSSVSFILTSTGRIAG